MYEKDKSLIINSQAGDEESMQKLIELNNGLIWGIVRKFWYREIEADDLYQIACIGFIKAVRRFDFSYNVELSTYAVQYIFGEIKKFLRDDGIIKISRNIKELGIKIKEIQNMYGDDIQEKKIAKMLGVTEEEVNTAINARQKIESINEYIYKEGNCEKIEKITSNDVQKHIDDKILISDLLDELKIRDREIIKLRYFKEKTQMQVAKVMGISQVQVSRIERRVLKQLKNELIQGEAII